MAKWNFDMISRAEADRQTQEAVAAVLMEAADLVDALSDDILDGAQSCAETHPAFSEDRQEHAEDARQVAVRIRALTTETAQTALTKMLAEAKAEGMREAVSLATALHRRFYQAQAPQWAPLEDVAGVISQIDNMTSGLADRIEELEAKLAKVISAYRMEALRRRDYTHDAFDRHIAELTGGKDEPA